MVEKIEKVQTSGGALRRDYEREQKIHVSISEDFLEVLLSRFTQTQGGLLCTKQDMS